MTDSRNQKLDVGALARVEGEGGLRVVVTDGAVSEVALNIYEPPRFFEAFLIGRRYQEVPDITARICGICPVAYQMSACAAIEDAFGVAVSAGIQDLRRLLYCGEWLQSHALHVHFLHAPDFFRCQDAIQLASTHPKDVKRGLALKKTGNQLMAAVGGRAVHPVNVRVGGFYSAPARSAIRALAGPLHEALEASLETVKWVSGFEFPDVEGDYIYVALRGDNCYPLEAGRIVASNGLDCSAAEFAEVAVEEHVARSNALHARLHGRLGYLTGPLARYALNYGSLTPLAKAAASEAGLGPVCHNPFRSIVVRAVETVFACEEALRLVDSYEPPDVPAVTLPAVTDVPGVTDGGMIAGVGATEAPRGLLLHRYEIDANGLIHKARIMPPTSQNQLPIEDDLRRVVEAGMNLTLEELTLRAETAVRNHDPCISCATHFLDVRVETRP